jgi:hypothetical protein
MLDKLDPTTHHAVNITVASMPFISLLMNANTWAIISGIGAAIYYAIIIAEKAAYWVNRWRGKDDGTPSPDSD